MRVALHDHARARVAKGEAGGVVSLRGAIEQEPAAPVDQGLARELLRELERRRLLADVDAGDQGGDVHLERTRPDAVKQRGIRSRAALVAGNVEARGVAPRVLSQRVDVR